MKKKQNFLVFYGGPGIGKTYLCSALVEWALKNFKSFRYYSEQDVLTRLRSHIDGGVGGDYTAHLRSLIDDELIILDDVGASNVTDWRREVLTEFLNIRYNSKLPTVITSNFSKNEFHEKYHGRVASRLFSTENTVIDGIEWPDLRLQGK